MPISGPQGGSVVVRSGIGHFEGQLRSQGASQPSGSGVTGGFIHYDTANGRFAFNDGTEWRGPAIVVGTAPSSPEKGVIWLDTAATGTGSQGLLNTIIITSETTLTASHSVVYCDATTGAFPVHLPPSADNTGRTYWIKKIDSTSNIITIDGDGLETIDGGLEAELTIQNEALTLNAKVTDFFDWGIL